MASIKRKQRAATSRQSRRSVKVRPSLKRAREHAPPASPAASANRRPDVDIVDVLQEVLRYAMKAARFNAARVARECGVDESTVSKWLSDGHAILVHRIMRSRRLWPHFLIHLFHRETAGGHVA